MTKVKMDVVRPWIATRVTEFLGFEDEVLINFIYGLLDTKVKGYLFSICIGCAPGANSAFNSVNCY